MAFITIFGVAAEYRFADWPRSCEEDQAITTQTALAIPYEKGLGNPGGWTFY